MSSPNSPVRETQQPRAVSNPYDLNKVEPCECITPSGERDILSRMEKAATIPRAQTGSGSSTQSPAPRGILKSSVTTSAMSCDVADDVSISRRDSYYGARSASAGPVCAENMQTKPDQSSDKRMTKSPSKVSETVRLETAFVGNAKSCEAETVGNSGASGRKSVTIASKTIEIDHEEDPSSPVDDDDSKSSEVTVIHKDCVRILAPQPQRLVPESPHSSRHSESPEWPSPPEPLTPQTPQTPTYHLEFDSDSIKRMLENLPISPETDSMTGSIHEHDLGFHEEAENANSNVPGNNSQGVDNVSTGCKDTGCDMNQCGNGVGQGDAQCCRAATQLDSGVVQSSARHSYGRESNPDSGFGGMAGDSSMSTLLNDGPSTHATGLVLLY